MSMLVVFYSFSMDLVPTYIFEVALPIILKQRSVSVSAMNVTYPTTTDDEVSVQIGVVLALFFVPWMIVGTLVGWMVAAYGGDVVYCLGRFVMSAANFLVAFVRPTSFPVLCTYASVFSVGCAMSEVSSYYLVAKKFSQDTMRSRIYVAAEIVGMVGTGVGYVFGSRAYQTFGHTAVFGCLACADLTVGSLYGLLHLTAQCTRNASPRKTRTPTKHWSSTTTWSTIIRRAKRTTTRNKHLSPT